MGAALLVMDGMVGVRDGKGVIEEGDGVGSKEGGIYRKRKRECKKIGGKHGQRVYV